MLQGTEVVVLVLFPSLASGSSVVSGVVGNYRRVFLVLLFTAVGVSLCDSSYGAIIFTLFVRPQTAIPSLVGAIAATDFRLVVLTKAGKIFS